MPDIFISYSRKGSTQAEELAERLRCAGLIWDRSTRHCGMFQAIRQLMEPPSLPKRKIGFQVPSNA